MRSIATIVVPAALALSSFAAVAAPTGVGSAFRDDPFSANDRYELAAPQSQQASTAWSVRSDDPFARYGDDRFAPRAAPVQLAGQPAPQPRPDSWDARLN